MALPAWRPLVTLAADLPGRRPLRWRFGGACFDEPSLQLTVAGQPVEVERRPLQLLALLLAHPGEIVTKAEILDALWPGREVSEASLTNCMARLRQALGEIGHTAIRTVHGYGYRFAAPVTVENTGPPLSLVKQATALAPGAAVPHRPNWSLVERLGAGGFGEAWLAEQVKSRERRVVKFAQDGIGVAALRREVALFRLLREGLGPRPDLIRVLDWQFSETPAFIETAWADQGNLAEWAARQGGAGALALDVRLDIAAQIAEALAAIHGMAVLHKDLKPANVLIRLDANGHPGIILTDFGSGRVLDPASLDAFGITRPEPDPTEADSSGGTQMYSAPELASGAVPSVQADIFALGIMLFQLVAGDLRRPLAPGWEELVGDPLLREDISEAAAGDFSRRLSDAGELAARLRALPERRAARARVEAEAAEAARMRRALDLARARRLPLMALLGVLVLALATSTTLFVRAKRAEARAETAAARATTVTAFLTDDVFSAANPLLGADPNVPVRRLLSIAASELDRRFQQGGVDRAAIEAAIGSAFAGLADQDDALKFLGSALATLRVTRGEDDPQTQAVRLAMARLAEHMLDRAGMRAAGQAMLAAHPADAATELVARFYVILGGCDYTGAEACAAQLRPLAAESAQRLGAGDKLTLKIQAELASRLGDALQFGEAIPMSRALIAQSQRVYGPGHLLVQERRFELAATLVGAGQLDEAIPMLIDVRRRMQALMGGETEISARVENQLGMAYYAAGRYPESVQAFQAARDFVAARRGENSILVLGAESNIANAMAHMGRTKEATTIAQHVFEVKRRAEGADSPDTLVFERNLAVDFKMGGDLAQAEAAYRDVVGRARKTMTHGEHNLGRWESEFGEILAQEGKLDEARAMLTESVATLTKSFGAQDKQTLHARNLLASLGAPAK